VSVVGVGKWYGGRENKAASKWYAVEVQRMSICLCFCVKKSKSNSSVAGSITSFFLQAMVNQFRPQYCPSFTCYTCNLVCKSGHGLTQHQQTVHHEFTPASEDDSDNPSFTMQTHPLLNGVIHSNSLNTWLMHYCKAIPCDKYGNNLPQYSPPPSLEENPLPNDWTPFKSRVEFDFSHYHFVEVQSSAANIDKALGMWAASVMEFGGDAPWKNSDDLYETIDAIQHGDL
jgi:hypothetical protein